MTWVRTHSVGPPRLLWASMWDVPFSSWPGSTQQLFYADIKKACSGRGLFGEAEPQGPSGVGVQRGKAPTEGPYTAGRGSAAAPWHAGTTRMPALEDVGCLGSGSYL